MAFELSEGVFSGHQDSGLAHEMEIVVQLSRGVKVCVFIHLSLSVVVGWKFPGLTGIPVLHKCTNARLY